MRNRAETVKIITVKRWMIYIGELTLAEENIHEQKLERTVSKRIYYRVNMQLKCCILIAMIYLSPNVANLDKFKKINSIS